MIAKIVSSTWPAAMLAKSRTARENGRRTNFEKNSIGTTRINSELRDARREISVFGM